MFGTVGGPELLLILVIALIVFGPRKLPEIGKSMGKMLHEFRKASNDFKQTIEDEVEADKVRSAPQLSTPVSSSEPGFGETGYVAPAAVPSEAPASVEPAGSTVSREAPAPPVETK